MKLLIITLMENQNLLNQKSLMIKHYEYIFLVLIVTTPGIKKEEIIEFFLETLGGLQSSKATIKFGIDIALRFLLKEELLIKKRRQICCNRIW